MPVYVYQCPKCSSIIELTRTVNERVNPLPVCVQEGCDAQQSMNIKLQPSGFVLKGSGWTKRN